MVFVTVKEPAVIFGVTVMVRVLLIMVAIIGGKGAVWLRHPAPAKKIIKINPDKLIIFFM